MAKSIFKNADIFVNTEKLSSLSNEMTLEYGANEQSITNFESDTDIAIGGLKNASVNVSGFWDSTSAGAGDPEKALFDAIGNNASQPAILVPETANSRAFILENAMTTYEIGGQVGEVFPITLNMVAVSDLSRGHRLVETTTATSGSSSSATLDSAVASTEEVIAVLIVLDGAGAGDTLDVTIEDQAANTVITFDQVVGDTKTYQIKTAASPGDTAFTANWTISSGSANWNFIVALGKRTT